MGTGRFNHPHNTLREKVQIHQVEAPTVKRLPGDLGRRREFCRSCDSGRFSLATPGRLPEDGCHLLMVCQIKPTRGVRR